MRNRFLRLSGLIISAVITGLTAFFILKNPAEISRGIKTGLTTVGGALIPSLFPFMVLSCFVQNGRAGEAFSAVFAPVSKHVFRLPSVTSTAVFMSFIGGYPVGARLTQLLLREGKITKKQAARMCLFCVNAGPAFVISTVGAGLLSNTSAGVILFVSVTLSSVIIGFLCGRLLADKTEIQTENITKPKCKNTFEAFTLGASQATSAMLSVCAYVLIFSALCEVLKGLDISNNLLAFLVGVSEVTNGVMTAAGSYPLPVISAIIGFGGLCVHCQVMGAVIESGLKLRYFFAVRFTSAALSAVICQALLYLFPVSVNTVAVGSGVTALPSKISLPCCAAFLLMSVSLIFDIAPKRKV